MRQEVLEEFDDPGLKATIKRLRGGHRASAALRQQVLGRLAELRKVQPEPSGSAPEPPNPLRMPQRGRTASRWRMAVAAVFILAIGGVAVQMYRHHLAEEREEYLAANQSLFNAMVAVQTRGEVLEPLRATPGSPAALAQDLQTRLGRSVPVVDLADSGWTLRSVGISQIASHKAAHWQWVRGPQTLAVFSLPASAASGTEELDHYELVQEGHPLAGYVKDGSLNCVVADPSVSLEEAIRLANSLRRG